MANSDLEEKQEKEYNDKLLDYLFTCEGGGATEAKSSTLAAKKPGIRLHFSRFALFPNSSKEESSDNKVISSHQGQESETIEEVLPEGAPPVEGFFYAKTYLNAGYVYIIDEGDPNLWYEYEVDSLGNYSPIYWANNKDSNGDYLDVRKSTGEILTEKTFKHGTVLWIAYSPVQWSIDYHTIMRTDTNRRNDRMIKVECTGFERGAESTSNFITPFDHTYNAFFSNNKTQPLWFSNKIKEIIADDNSALEKDPQSIKEDMFVTLQDPISNIKEACGKYSEEFLKFKALCEAIQTGETIDEAFERLVLEKKFSATKNRDHQDLFALANFSYQHAFGDKRSMQKYSDSVGVNEVETYLGEEYITTNTSYYGGREIKSTDTLLSDGVDLKKLVGILGVDERREAKEKLIRLRNIVFDYFKSEYPFKNSDDYLHNNKIKTLDGRSAFYKLMGVLYTNPHDIDANLDLPEDRVTKDEIKEKFEQLIIDKKLPSDFKLKIKSKAPSYTEDKMLVALSAKKLDVDQPSLGFSKEEKEEISIKSAIIMQGGLTVIASRAFSTITSNKSTYKTFSFSRKLNVVQQEIVEQFNKGLLINHDELLALKNNDIILSFQDQYAMVYREGSQLKLDMIPQELSDMRMTRLKSEKLTSNQIRANKFNNKLAKIVNCNHFIACMGMLATYNLIKSVGQLNQNDTWKNRINTFSYIANVAEVALSINTKYAKLYKIPKLEYSLQAGAIKNVENLTKVAGAIGGVLTCGVCVMDSLELFSQDNIDSGVVMLAAGAGFAVSGIAPLLLSETLGGPVAWGALIVATGLYFLSEALKDDDFQKIYKHYLLSNYKNCDKEGLTPMEYVQKILKQKEELTDPNYRVNREGKDKPNLEDPRNAYLLLMEEAIMPNIKVKGLSTQSNPDNILLGWYNSFSIAISFNNYMNSDEDVDNAEISALLYSQHPKSYGNSRNDNISISKKRKDNVLLLKVLIDKYTSYISKEAFCDVFIRLKNISGSEFFFPFNNEKGEQRFIKLRLKLHCDVRSNNKIKGSYSIVPKLDLNGISIRGNKNPQKGDRVTVSIK